MLIRLEAEKKYQKHHQTWKVVLHTVDLNLVGYATQVLLIDH